MKQQTRGAGPQTHTGFLRLHKEEKFLASQPTVDLEPVMAELKT